MNDNFVSAEAAVLDKIQYDNDVIFVVAGTNKPSADVEKIGSPADSINSMVVNAVTKNGLSTKYTRRGLALSFLQNRMLVIMAEARNNILRSANH